MNNITLDSYVDNEYLTQNQKNVICEAVKNHKNIIVVGGTGSGKTILANAVMLEMAEQFPTERFNLVDELNDVEALDLFNTWGKKQSSGICTVHANTVKSGLSRVQDLVSKNSSCIDDRDIKSLPAETIGILVFITNDSIKNKVIFEVYESKGINDESEIEVKKVA